MFDVVSKLGTVPEPRNIYINTASALVLLSDYVNNGSKESLDAIINRDYDRILSLRLNSIDPYAILLLGLTMLENHYPSGEFYFQEAIPNDLAPDVPPIPIIQYVDADINYIVGYNRLPPGYSIEDAEPSINFITYSDRVYDMDTLKESNPNLTMDTINQALAVNSDFVSLLGSNRNAIEDIYTMKRQRVIGFLDPVVSKQLV